MPMLRGRVARLISARPCARVMSLRRQYFSIPVGLRNVFAGHFCTMNVSLPNCAELCSMSFSMARMAVMTTMMEKTPTMTPEQRERRAQLVRHQRAHRHEKALLHLRG